MPTGYDLIGLELYIRLTIIILNAYVEHNCQTIFLITQTYIAI